MIVDASTQLSGGSNIWVWIAVKRHAL